MSMWLLLGSGLLIQSISKKKIIFTAGPGGPLGPVGPSFPVKPCSETKARLEKNFLYNYIIAILLITTNTSFKTYPQYKL